MIAVGQTIGNYRITAKLGEGGMGVVYLAEHPVIGRKVALKAIHPELSRNPEVVSRFMIEAKAVNQIGNEHIVDINDFGTTPEGEFYFIMEFLQGESLADKLKRESILAAPRALQIAAQVADALASSHEHGIIHRDLKPENIFLINKASNTEFVKVLDFGLAKLTMGEEKVTHKTRTGSVMGTPYYMAPEQCEGKANIDHRADLYSLGVILFEMLTGRVPFGGDGYGEIIVKHITQAPPSPRAINPMLTDAHEALLVRALRKAREERFQTMAEFRTAMLDPDRYMATAGPPPSGAFAKAGGPPKGASPAQLADSGVSGQVVFGGPMANAGADLGARSGPMPSTFRHGAGELLEEEAALSPPKSRKGLLVGAILAAAAAGAGAFVLTRGGPSAEADGVVTTPPAPAEVTAPSPDPTPAPAATKVTIKFQSTPEGAEVFRNGAKLGQTPFEQEMDPSETALEVVFKKDGFDDQTLTVVPRTSAVLATTLVKKETPEPAEPVARGKPAKASAAARAKPNGGRGKKPQQQESFSGDDVLTPAFLKEK